MAKHLMPVAELEHTSSTTKFFIPHVPGGQRDGVYGDIVAAVKDQLKCPITERRIARLVYRNGRRMLTAAVGSQEQMEGHYEVVAILESKFYVVVTKSSNGAAGPCILVDAGDVAVVESFKE